mmetsp:Transcript_32807/g.49592  ORF Transcript_32807/g.49592 Transcript_32807/m.49592 type:complete len:91 (-) Transcript_32807:186-458(-)
MGQSFSLSFFILTLLLTCFAHPFLNVFPPTATLALQENDFVGVMSDSLCNATVKGNARIQLRSLTIDCEEVTCECCTNCGITARPRPRGS